MSLIEDYYRSFIQLSAVTAINANFHFSPRKSMEILSCLGNQCSVGSWMKNSLYWFPLPINTIYEIWQQWPRSFREDVVRKRITDERRMPAYTISSPVRLRLKIQTPPAHTYCKHKRPLLCYTNKKDTLALKCRLQSLRE